ncbi:MAG: hypothetical protein OEV44_05355 [Spirochaetota bacterium]|nr:hypothetical protein [Spirochaetota bacterium]
MNIRADSLLLSKIDELENYIMLKYPKKNLKINDFLSELKSIEPNLTVIGLLNHLVEMYKEGSNINDIVQDVNKTKKVFSMAGEYMRNLESDNTISSISKEIHEIILNQIDCALQLYKDEYDIPV